MPRALRPSVSQPGKPATAGSFQTTISTVSRSNRPEWPGFERAIERADVGRSLVAVAGARIIGMGFAGPPEDDQLPEGTGEVFAVYVLPDWQGRGVGRALLERLTSGLRALGYHTAILWTLRDRRATRRFYEANGWAFDGTEDRLDLQGPVHLVRYARDLSEQP